jgi:ABC-type nitrate/sulfonate/bicarbonate transport system substrate-binding protein
MSVVLKTIVFPGGFNLPLWTGLEQGFFKKNGVDIDITFTTNSVQQLGGLIHGEWDIGLTGFDNVVAYQEGQGEAKLDREPDLFAFMGGDNAFLRLMVQPDIRSYDDLRGKVLSVDALTTGFAFVLRKMLALNGIAEEEVRFESAGGAVQRFEALKQGKHAGTLLLTPFDLIGEKAGLRVLQSASDVIPRYQGVVGAARRGWASENVQVLTGFIAGYLESLAWLYEPNNAAAACAILSGKVPNMTADMASATCGILLADRGGFEPRAQLDPEGMNAVLALRSEYGTPKKMLVDPQRYCDLSYYNLAT